MVDRRFIMVLQSWAQWPTKGSADHIGRTSPLASLVTSVPSRVVSEGLRPETVHSLVGAARKISSGFIQR